MRIGRRRSPGRIWNGPQGSISLRANDAVGPPGALQRLRKTTWRFQQTFRTPLNKNPKARIEGARKLSILNWSHPPGSNRRPADYEKSAPAPNAPLALYGSACYQQLGEAAFAQIATSNASNRWGFWHSFRTGGIPTKVGEKSWHASEQCR